MFSSFECVKNLEIPLKGTVDDFFDSFHPFQFPTSKLKIILIRDN